MACHDVIGVYEPVVQVSDGSARQTSRAAEPRLARAEDACYHLRCYESRENDG